MPPAIAAEAPYPGPLVLLLNLAADHVWAGDTALAIAESWSRAGRRVVLADLHLEEPVLHERVGEANLDGVVDIFQYGASVARSARPVRDHDFYLIPAGTYTARPDEVYAHPRWAKLVTGFRDAGATLLVFVPAAASGLDPLVELAHCAVVLGEPGRPDQLPVPAELVRAVLVHPAALEPAVGPAASVAPAAGLPAVLPAPAEPDAVAEPQAPAGPGAHSGPETPAELDVDAGPDAGAETEPLASRESRADPLAAAEPEAWGEAEVRDRADEQDEAEAWRPAGGPDDAGPPGEAEARDEPLEPPAAEPSGPWYPMVGSIPTEPEEAEAEVVESEEVEPLHSPSGEAEAPTGSPGDADPDRYAGEATGPGEIWGEPRAEDESEAFRETVDAAAAANTGSRGHLEEDDLLLAARDGESAAPRDDATEETIAIDEWPAEAPHDGPPLPPLVVGRPRRRRRSGPGPLIWLLVVAAAVVIAALVVAMLRPDLFGSPRRANPELAPAEEPGPVAALPVAPPAPVAAGDTLPYAVQVRAYATLGSAQNEAAQRNRELADALFYVVPEPTQGVLYFKVMAGLLPDTAAATELRRRLVQARVIAAADARDDAPGVWSLVQSRPLAFELGEMPSLDEALAEVDSLAARGVPVYPVAVPYSDGSERWRLYGGAYPNSFQAEEMRQILEAANLPTRLVARVGRLARETP